MKKKVGKPRVEKRKRETQNENIKEGVVDKIWEVRKEGSGGIIREGREPFREGTNVRAKEGIDGIGESMVGTESAAGNRREGGSGGHGVHHVGPRAWHASRRSKKRSLVEIGRYWIRGIVDLVVLDCLID